MNKYFIGGLVVVLGLAAAFMATQKKEVGRGKGLCYRVSAQVVGQMPLLMGMCAMQCETWHAR